MKKLSLVFIIFILLIGQKVDAKPLDGSDWREWGEAPNKITGELFKGLYIKGYLDGSKIVVINVNQLIKEIKELKTDKGETVIDDELTKFALELINKELQRLKITGIPVNIKQVVDGLDVLYEDYKNRNIQIAYAIHVVKKQIQGASEEEINAILEYLRGGMKDKSKLKYKDKTGKLQEAKFP